jgi:hypothetical protein
MTYDDMCKRFPLVRLARSKPLHPLQKERLPYIIIRRSAAINFQHLLTWGDPL